MRPSTKLLSALVVLGLGLVPSGLPSAATPGVRARTVTRAVVYGRDADVSRNEATSFELFGRRTATRGSSVVGTGTPRSLTPQTLSGFDGLADPCCRPSDTTGALGDTFIVVAVNTQVVVYDRSGTQVVAPIQLDQLHPNTAGRFVFDPKVVYDQYNDTFVLVYLAQEDTPRFSRIISVAIPNATANDPTTWCAVSFKGDQVPGAPSLWADYPGLGYNDTRVTITTNQFTFPSSRGRFRSSQVMTIDKAGLYDCLQPAPVPTVFAGTQTRDDNDIRAFTLRPAETVGSVPGPQLLLSLQCSPVAKCFNPPFAGKHSYLTVWRIKPKSTGFALKKRSMAAGRVAFPPLGTQGGGGLDNFGLFWDTGDYRLINAFYDADRNTLFTAHTVFKNLEPDTLTGGYPEAVIRWYEIDPASSLRDSVIGRKGLVGDTEVDVGWPSVATDDSGVLFITYSRASDPRNEFLSAWVSTIQPGSTSDTEFLLHAGSATYNAQPGPERWGDFTAINRDPTNGQTVATFNQYAESAVQWRQFVSLVTDN